MLLGRRYRWFSPLIADIHAQFLGKPRPKLARLAECLANDPRLLDAYHERALCLRHYRLPSPIMWPAPGSPQSWNVPPILTIAELARFLELEPNQLDWFADRQSRERIAAVEPLRHYRCRWVAKPSGNHRLIEAPKPRLKRLQRQLLDTILLHIPPHDAAHGFRPGRSTSSFVAPHVRRKVLLKMDLRDFFVSINDHRVISIYLTAGYPEPVARCLAGLSTNVAPRSVLKTAIAPTVVSVTSIAAQWRNTHAYRVPHLPQGAPTSPALANLVAYRLDARLAALAKAADATYTRYADDLLFSGDDHFARAVQRFPASVAAIASDEGFAVQHHKTRVMRQSVRQRAAGIVVNEKLNLSRHDFDTLKATLTNAVRHGPHNQNHLGLPDFRAHLAGRVAYAVQLNPNRGQKLANLFSQISW